MKIFLDDLFSIFIGTTKKLHNFFEEINQIHPNIKFTMDHTTPQFERQEDRCPCNPKSAVPFLDTSCSIKDGQIIMDLYRKPTDTKEMRYEELSFRDDRNYPLGMIESAMKRARAIPREMALHPVARTTRTTRRPVFVVTWDPRLPSLLAINQKHWRTMTEMDPYLSEVFPQPPLIAFKRQKNIKDYTVRAKIPPVLPLRPRRVIPGMKKCQKQCHACPYVKEGKEVKNKYFTWKINKSVNCESSNIVYLIECNNENCSSKYIGESERPMKDCLGNHKGYINNNQWNQPTGEHFNLPGHSINNLTITILEKVKKVNSVYRKEREKYLIRKFNSYYSGMNRTPGYTI